MSKKSETKETSAGWNCLAVTQVQVFPFRECANLGHVKGLATVVLNDQLTLRGLRIMEGENGLFVGYPADPFYKGEDLRSIFFPITRQLREHIENCVLEKYQAELDPEWDVIYEKNGTELHITVRAETSKVAAKIAGEQLEELVANPGKWNYVSAALKP